MKLRHAATLVVVAVALLMSSTPKCACPPGTICPPCHATHPATLPHKHCRDAVIGALSSLPQHGFDQLDRTLIVHAALVSGAYVAFHRKWLRAVQVGG